MKYLLPLIIIVAVSCKKKDINHTPISVSKGVFLAVVVSDSVEYAVEYEANEFLSLNESPLNTSSVFNGTTGITYYDMFIDAYGVGPITHYRMEVPSFYAMEFINFYGYHLVDSVPGEELDEHAVYNVSLDTSRIDFIFGSNLPEELEFGWSKIQNLRIVSEYRKNYPDSRIGFLYLEKADGESRRYFFMSKYRP
ncbi:hypothetical protein [uncultured Fluviicola sp.]|uniref:hypothetical protein n=1 Tax=uncultured Fluviicola sp. TaxID=463303 RepID=UPI0025EFAB95|nr:hypothetical protein [uncultured Fluviicola sp.]